MGRAYVLVNLSHTGQQKVAGKGGVSFILLLLYPFIFLLKGPLQTQAPGIGTVPWYV